MRTVRVDGKEYILKNADEVSYGAEKELERVQFAASLAMLSDDDVAELAQKSKEKKGKVDEDEFVNCVMSGDVKKSLLDSHDATITPEEEAIILSAGLTRKEIMDMPGKSVRQLAKEAMEEMGTVEDFSVASDTDTK